MLVPRRVTSLDQKKSSSEGVALPPIFQPPAPQAHSAPHPNRIHPFSQTDLQIKINNSTDKGENLRNQNLFERLWGWKVMGPVFCFKAIVAVVFLFEITIDN